MSGSTLIYIILVAAMWFLTKGKKLNIKYKIFIGVIFGLSSVLSTHAGVSYENMVMNVRDIGPLAAGLFFSPLSGIIAGLIGGIERYIAGTYFDVGTYTRIACSLSTCLAGFVAMVMNIKVLNRKKPSPFYAFFMGAVMEVFHMYVVFITHRGDMRMAFSVVSKCSVPMIMFTGIGMAISSIMLEVFIKEWKNPFKRQAEDTIPVSRKFQRWLFFVTSIVIAGNFMFAFLIQTQVSYQDCKETLVDNASYIKEKYLAGLDYEADKNVDYYIISKSGEVLKSSDNKPYVPLKSIHTYAKGLDKIHEDTLWGIKCQVYMEEVDKNTWIITTMADDEAYWYRDAQGYESALGNILLFTVIYVLIAYLVNQIVVNNILLINKSLGKITNGDLNEVVKVRSSSEFASLSDDINQTVLTLKGYIKAAEKRIEQELILAKAIQESALPKNFRFPNRDEFEIYATMKAAKEVGGDFYDFFFVERDKIALVISDVSGKSIPAALFMMRSKTAIRSFAEEGASPWEIIVKANNELCEGNDAGMFVTTWIGIVDLKTGVVRCANAGHEYPTIMKKGQDYEILKDKHSMPLGAMPGTKAKEYEIQLEPGDRIFVYTDGVAEATNEKLEQFGLERMLDELNKDKDKPIDESLDLMFESLKKYKGNAEQFDDITMLGFEFKKYSK